MNLGFTSFIAEFSCIGVKYSETIPGANGKAAARNKNEVRFRNLRGKERKKEMKDL